MHTNQGIKNDEDQIKFIDDRIVERLSQALMFTLQIQDGIQLVSAIGNGSEANNKEAIKSWINSQQLVKNEIGVSETLAFLEDRLSNIFIELKTRHQCYL